jgi:hypothetical protein
MTSDSILERIHKACAVTDGNIPQTEVIFLYRIALIENN